MRLERAELLDLDASLALRWLETDGLGGCASLPPLPCPGSRRDGLLSVPVPGDTARHLLLSRFDEFLALGDREFPLSLARYPGVLHPAGHVYADFFELRPWPATGYRVGEVEVVREVLMPRGTPGVLVRWTVRGAEGPAALRLRPFLPFRRADLLTFENLYLERRVEPLEAGFRARPYPSLPALAVAVSPAPRFEEDPQWYRRVEYAEDAARGEAAREDQFSPGVLVVTPDERGEIVLAASIEEPLADPAALFRREARRRRRAAPRGAGIRAALEAAPDRFLHLAPGGRLAVTAGFPHYGEWGRDTFVSLPGFLLPAGEVEALGEALAATVGFLKDGRMPDRFGRDPESSEYGAVDPVLWFARAVRGYDLAGGRRRRLERILWPALLEAGRSLRAAVSEELSCDEEGLLSAGTSRCGATWMDATPEATACRSRRGFAVEVNALWHFLASYLAEASRRSRRPRDAREWAGFTARLGRAFLRRFWLPEERTLADLWRDGAPDRSIRPNAVIAASLEWSPLSRARRRLVVARARAELLTPRGLRTLSPADPRYRGRVEGDAHVREAALIDGAAWPWLLGPYAEASIRALGRTKAVRAHLRDLLAGFDDHLRERGLLLVGEAFDGDPPHRPAGAFAQAWSMAELARVAGMTG